MTMFFEGYDAASKKIWSVSQIHPFLYALFSQAFINIIIPSVLNQFYLTLNKEFIMPQPKNITVTVTVDTETITQANVDTTIVLTDDNNDHDQKPDDSSTFDIVANNGAQITFDIAQKDGGTGVSFVSFEQAPAPSGGKSKNLMNPLPKAPTNWRATVNGNQKDTEYFTIKVSVPGKGEFTLDPEVSVKGP